MKSTPSKASSLNHTKTDMKKLLTSMAVLTVAATPAFAHYGPTGNIGQTNAVCDFARVAASRASTF